ncbi:hypothetical protein RsTz2092_06590 [Deferribacterales bacterium RsTz2092]|nr:hypothetical protein AGMMS49941_03320 [Deferribacterales bacterium]
MERMDSVRHLLEMLTSLVSLYSELLGLLLAEKEAIAKWETKEIVEVTKKKDALLTKEAQLNVARTDLIAQISVEYSAPMNKLSDIIDVVRGVDLNLSDELENVGFALVELVSKISAENLALRSIYNTNSKLIVDFFSAIGMTSLSGYKTSINTPPMLQVMG